jgi:hypothetical protein
MRDYLGFFVLVGLTLIVILFGRYGLRQYGLNRPISEYQTPLIKELIRESSGQALIYSRNDPNFVWEAASFQDSQWSLNSDPKILLKGWLEESSGKKRILFFSGKSSRALPELRKLLEKNQHWKTTVLCSRFDGLLKDLRELEPQWSFCNGEISMTRLLAFASLGLESLLEITADVVFIHLDQIKPNSEMKSIITEAKRQNKFVMMGPVPRPLEGFSPQGWVVETEDQKVQ